MRFFNQQMLDVVDQLPIMSQGDLIYLYTLSVLNRSNANRTHTALKLEIGVRNLRYRLTEMEILRYPVPQPIVGPIENFKSNKESNDGSIA